MVRVRMISGKKFVVTVKYTENNLVIIGDLRAEKELKVIEVPR